MSPRYLLVLTLGALSLLALLIGLDFAGAPPAGRGPASIAGRPDPRTAVPLSRSAGRAASGPAGDVAGDEPPAPEVGSRLSCRAGDVVGRIVDPDGWPVGGARAVLVRPGRAPVAATTGADGRIAFALPPESTAVLTLVARADGWAPGVVDRTRAQGTTDFGDVQLGVGGGIAGTVLDDRGLPGTAARLRLVPAGGALRRLKAALVATLLPECVVQADGSFACAALPPGPYFVEATAPCCAMARTDRLAVAAGAVTHIAPLVLRSGRALGGSVFDAMGAPVAGGSVDAIAARGDRTVHHTTTDATGAFGFDHLAAGSYHLRIRSAGVPELLVRDVGDGGPLVVRLPGGCDLVGRVTAPDEDPLLRFEVCLRPWVDGAEALASTERAERARVARLAALAERNAAPREDLDDALRRLAELASARRERERELFPFGVEPPARALGRHGTFAISRPAPGTYTLEIAAPGRAVYRTEPLTVPSEGAAAAVEVTLPRR